MQRKVDVAAFRAQVFRRNVKRRTNLVMRPNYRYVRYHSSDLKLVVTHIAQLSANPCSFSHLNCEDVDNLY